MALIRGTWHERADGTGYASYAWDSFPGDTDPHAVRIPLRALDARRVGAVIYQGHLRLRVVARMAGYCVVMRDDWRVWPRIAWEWGRGVARLVYSRLLWTAEVWGLAACEENTYPSWRELHAARWLMHHRARKGRRT